MQLYIKQKVFSIKDRFNIYDRNGEVKYKAEGEIFTLGKKLHIYDNNGTEIIYIKQKLASFLPKYSISVRGNEPVEVVKKFTFIKHAYAVPDWDIEIKGNFIAHNYQVFRGSQEIARLDKELFSFGDAYEIDIYNPQDELTVLALILVIDCCMENSNNAH